VKNILFAGLIFSCLSGCTQSNSTTKQNQQSISPDSLFTLGMYYLNEDTDKPQYDSAKYYLEKAVESNHKKSLHVLGYEYLLGSKLQRDKKKGLSYLEKASELGETEAYLSLAEFYYYQNEPTQVKAFLEKGSSLGDKYAMYQLHMLYYEGYAFGQPQKKDESLINLQKGFDYLLRAAEMGSLNAQLALVYLYAKGKQGLLEADIKKSKYYFELAEKNPEAQEVPGATDELEIAKKELNF